MQRAPRTSLSLGFCFIMHLFWYFSFSSSSFASLDDLHGYTGEHVNDSMPIYHVLMSTVLCNLFCSDVSWRLIKRSYPLVHQLSVLTAMNCSGHVFCWTLNPGKVRCMYGSISLDVWSFHHLSNALRFAKCYNNCYCCCIFLSLISSVFWDGFRIF